MECSHCGAHLALPEDGSLVARCEYCGKETMVQSQQAPPAPQVPSPQMQQQMQQQLQQQVLQQQQWAQQQQLQQPIYGQQDTRMPGTKGIGTIIMITTLAPLVLGGIITAATFCSVGETVDQVTGNMPSMPSTPSTPSRSSGSPAAAAGGGGDSAGSGDEAGGSTRWHGGACLVDGNGDKALDVAGLVGEDEDSKAALVDGASGEVLWRAGSFADRAYVFCPLDGWVGVATPEAFELDLFPVDDPEGGHIARSLSDEPSEWGAGDGCVSVRSSDRTTIGIALPDGDKTDCDARPRRDFRDEPGLEDSITEERYRVEHEGVVYTLREQQSGTEFLEVSAKEGGEQLWERPLKYVRAGGGTGDLAMIPTPGMLVVLGSDRKEDDKVTALGLDVKTGMERWSRKLPKRPSFQLQSLHYNGRYVLYSEMLSHEVVAVDPSSGEQSWRVGASNMWGMLSD